MTEHDALRAVAEAATQSKWLVNPFSALVEVPDRDAPICALLWPTDLRSEDETYANARHIATFDPPTVLGLLDTIATLTATLAARDAEIARQDARIVRQANCLSFFRSVIKCGEGWTATCEHEYQAALKESDHAN